MKKKFVLTLALVLMVVVGLSAATPLEVSGSFKAGYNFTFVSSGNGITRAGDEASINAVVALTGDFWKVALTGGPVDFDNDMRATASIYLDKALAAQGMDMGDLALTITIGNKTTLGGLSVYTNSRDGLNPLEMAGTQYSTAVQADYGTLVSVYAGADIASFDTVNKPIVLSAKTMPVDGVKAAVAYTNIDTDSADGSVAGSVTVDVAALAGLDFGLTASAYDVYLLTPKTNRLYVELKGSYDKISAWTEYRILDTKVNDMKVSASYSGIENVGLSAYVELNDITKEVATKVESKIGGGVTYKMGGVTYAVDANYATVNKTFTMSPTVKIAF